MQYNSFDCSLKEEGFKDDPSSLEATTPTFLAYSGNGTTQGALVYVNYGREEDFVELENRGISVEGKVSLFNLIFFQTFFFWSQFFFL